MESMLYAIIAILCGIIIILSFKKKKRSNELEEEEKALRQKLHEKEIEGLNQIEEKLKQKKEEVYQDS